MASPADLAQSQGNVIAPGIVGLFIQGLETGLVISQLSRWLSTAEHTEGIFMSLLVIFVATVGFVQTGICFASVWRNYVQHFGQLFTPTWADFIHVILTLPIAVPIQALMIRRCYYIVGKNMYIIGPLVLLLLSSIAMSIWGTVISFRFEATDAGHDVRYPKPFIAYPFLMCIVLPAVLDFMLTGILLFYLTRSMKRVYSEHIRRRISRLITVAWQSAVPPTICSICLAVIYIENSTLHPRNPTLWYPVLMAMTGKLYVLSLFYMLNTRIPLADGSRTTYVSTLTVPVGGMATLPYDMACIVPSSPPQEISIRIEEPL
ncbi:hypothetical protein BC834DRAFT_888024 [Gloeopeniophorella convolvens]|nr:hypothetical protein BC834DRAFT_888024 [Gloeopeniophorella convolvens]